MQELLDMMEGSFVILRDTYHELIDMSPKSAIVPVDKLPGKLKEIYNKKEKKDTLFMDVLAEQNLSGIDEHHSGHLDLVAKVLPGHEGVWITEERGVITKNNSDPLSKDKTLISAGTPVFISDPIDQSRQIEEMAANPKYRGYKRFGKIFDEEQKLRGNLARVDAPNVSVTMLKNNSIMYSMVLNLLTREIYVGSARGVFVGDISSAKSLSDIVTPLKFRKDFCVSDRDNAQKNLTMIAYAYGDKYVKNLEGTNLSYFIHESSVPQPPGPLRFTYLLDGHASPVPDVGLIAYNGEKVQELLPSISMAYFSKGGLAAWKLFCRPDFLEERAGKDMTPHLRNSLFKGYMRNDGIEYTHMNRHRNPNNFRDTVVIVPSHNYSARTLMRGMENHAPEETQAIRII